jgi:hypothetical protein
MDEAAFDARTGNRFRRALLVRGPARRTAPVEPAYHADVRSDEEIDLAADTPQCFLSSRGVRATVTLPRTKAALMALAMVFPDSLARSELDRAADQLLEHLGIASGGADEGFGSEWQQVVSCHLAWVCAGARHFERPAAAAPRLHRLGWEQARRGLPLVGARHLALDLDRPALDLARLLDGSRSPDALAAAIRPSLEDSAGATDEASIGAAVEDMLALFARHGLLAQPAA